MGDLTRQRPHQRHVQRLGDGRSRPRRPLAATVSVDAAFVLDAVTYLISAALLALTPARPQREEDSAGFGEDLKAGFTYLAGARVLLR